jgi:multidrug resistance efflux pump
VRLLLTQHPFRKAAPWATWLLVVAVAYWLHRESAGTGQAGGIAEVKEFTVSSMETGRLATLEVIPGQRVWQGQVVARMDSAILDRELAVADAELRELEARIPAEDKSLEFTVLESERAFQAEVEQAAIALQAARSTYARDRAELDSVQTELSRQRDLVARHLAQADRMKDLEVKRAALEQEVTSWPTRIGGLEARERAARERMATWRSSHGVSSGLDARKAQLRPLELRVVRQRAYLALLKQRLAATALLAPAYAFITNISARPGDVLTPGAPVLVMVEANPSQVIAYAEEDRGYALSVGGKTVIRRRVRSADRFEGTITAIAGTVSQLPVRFWPAPNRPRWGREVFIAIGSGRKLDPGEAVDITFPAKGGLFHFASAARAAASGPEPSNTGLVPLVVPPAIRSKSRFEPSGHVWLDSIQRYLVVSDDTGLESARDNAPWVFAVSRDGVVDREPWPIHGVESVNDLEAITASPDGKVYMIASQSANRAGKRRGRRTVFLQARVAGRALTAVACVSFYDALVEAAFREPSLLASLGLESNPGAAGPSFEIEGLTWHEGALFLGLKAPLDSAGQALIWRLASPDHLFRSGSLSGSDLTLWRRVPLAAAGRPAGISELLFLPGGDLLLAATNSEGGALFRARASAGESGAPERLASYPRLKPEGLSLTPDHQGVVVVFDRQQETPLWTRLEISQ